ncbi:MAG: formylglycine-generating enzyme family protein [Desulfobacterales bacterium]
MRKSVKVMGICTVFFILAMGGLNGPVFAGAVLDIDGNGTVDGGTDGLLVNRYLFGFRGTTLISNAVGSACTRCSAAEIEAYIAALVGLGDTYTNSLGMTFKLIPAGTFMMGSPTDELGRSSSEVQHQVTLTQDFYMMTTEVTQRQWLAVMGSNPSYFVNCGSNCPVEQVSWNDVQTFITAMNTRGEGTYRLPTEAEWEYAARAGSTTAFANGGITNTGCTPLDSNMNEMGWYCGNAGVTYTGCYDASSWGGPSCAGTHPVAQNQPNDWGLYDMHGNVWEWVQDWFGAYPTSAVINPFGPSTGWYQVHRGGSWSRSAGNCRSAYRVVISPGSQFDSYGFRLVLSSGQ